MQNFQLIKKAFMADFLLNRFLKKNNQGFSKKKLLKLLPIKH